MIRPNTLSYRTQNWLEYNQVLRRRGSVTVWFDPDLAWAATLTGKQGRQTVSSDPAIHDLPHDEGAVR